MSKTYVKTFNYNYDISRSGQSYTSLEERIDKHLSEHPNAEILQLEHLWGDRYGARTAVLFREDSI